MSVVRVGLPRTADPAATSPATIAPVLIVDDNPTKRLALKAVLEPLGCAIVEADSGLAALRCMMVQDFAVILLDVRMPVMDGFETAGLIRRRRESEMTPIIFITAYRDDEYEKIDRYAEGAVDFISTPVAADELRAKVSVFANLFTRALALAARSHEVQASVDQLKQLTDAAPVGIFQTDAQLRYVYTNPCWSEIAGITAEDADGRHRDIVFGEVGRAEGVSGPSGDAVRHRFEIDVANAPSRIAVLTSTSILGSDGTVVGSVGTLADVTAEAGAEAAMSKARDEATEASRLKSDFLANMSHEIRTPMNGVIGMTELLLETHLDARQRDYAQTVRTSGEALLTIINDILDFSKVETGNLEVEDIDFDLRSAVEDAANLLAGQAQAKGLELVTFVDGALPEVVGGDPSRVRQVLTNLIGNAIKFTHAGEIVVRVTLTKALDDAALVRFEVSDTGDGIAADKLAMIFHPFVQADTSTSRKYGGTGLGLAISSRLVGLMGGDCGVSSEPGAGSTFWFTIRVGAEIAGARSLPSYAFDLEGVAALIVDDSATQRGVLSKYLHELGMIVSTAGSGEAALEALRSAAADARPISVALIDRSLPGMDGVQLSHAIAQEPGVSAALVLMTALSDTGDIGDPAGLGFAASVVKPVRHKELRDGLRVAMGLQKPEVAPVEVAEPVAPALTQGRLLLAEDNVVNQKVAVAMLSSGGYDVDTVIDGAAAVQAVATTTYDAVLMDCQMPVVSGYEATVTIRADEGSDRHTPIIALTAGARAEDRERCLAAGMDSYLSKPVGKDALLALVRSVARRPAADVPPSPGREPAPEQSAIDPEVFDELRELAKDSGSDLLSELVEQFVSDTGPLLVQIRQAFEAGDADAVRRIAHGLKGSAGQLGGRRLAAACAGRVSDGQVDLETVEREYEELRRALTDRLSDMRR